MTKCIINGVLLDQPEGSKEWHAETKAGLAVAFVPVTGAWAIRLGHATEPSREHVYRHLPDAVQAVRSRGHRFADIEANASAHKAIHGDTRKPGWDIRPYAYGEPSVFIPARGRMATVSDLYRRSEVIVPGTLVTAASVVPVYLLGV